MASLVLAPHCSLLADDQPGERELANLSSAVQQARQLLPEDEAEALTRRSGMVGEAGRSLLRAVACARQAAQEAQLATIVGDVSEAAEGTRPPPREGIGPHQSALRILAEYGPLRQEREPLPGLLGEPSRTAVRRAEQAYWQTIRSAVCGAAAPLYPAAATLSPREGTELVRLAAASWMLGVPGDGEDRTTVQRMPEWLVSGAAGAEVEEFCLWGGRPDMAAELASARPDGPRTSLAKAKYLRGKARILSDAGGYLQARECQRHAACLALAAGNESVAVTAAIEEARTLSRVGHAREAVGSLNHLEPLVADVRSRLLVRLAAAEHWLGAGAPGNTRRISLQARADARQQDLRLVAAYLAWLSAVAQGDYDIALREGRQILSSWPDHPLSQDVCLVDAMGLLALRQYGAAGARLRAYRARTQESSQEAIAGEALKVLVAAERAALDGSARSSEIGGVALRFRVRVEWPRSIPGAEAFNHIEEVSFTPPSSLRLRAYVPGREHAYDVSYATDGLFQQRTGNYPKPVMGRTFGAFRGDLETLPLLVPLLLAGWDVLGGRQAAAAREQRVREISWVSPDALRCRVQLGPGGEERALSGAMAESGRAAPDVQWEVVKDRVLNVGDRRLRVPTVYRIAYPDADGTVAGNAHATYTVLDATVVPAPVPDKRLFRLAPLMDYAREHLIEHRLRLGVVAADGQEGQAP